MNTINQAYINALLSDSAYRSVNSAMTPEQMADELSLRMTSAQSAFLATNFTVLSSIETAKPLGSGFDAVVWRGKPGTDYAGQVYVSMRGTQGAEDIADDVTLAAKGIPYDQIRDMVNWWLKSTASTSNTNVVQIKVVDIPGSVVGRTFALDTPTTGTGELEGLGPITGVNGHSLGGYLATAFTRLFGNGWSVQAVNTFNSAGFNNLMATNTNGEFSNIAGMIGASKGLDSFEDVGAKQTNYYAQNGWSVTTNAWGEMGFLMPGFNQYGARTALNQEDLVFQGGAGIDNHSMYKLTDMLALGAALETLDPGMDTATLNAMMPSGSNQVAGSIEGLFDALRRALEGPGIADASIGDVGDSAQSRVDYHAALAKFNLDHKNLAGKLSIGVAAKEMETYARNDFAALVALQDLSPIVVRGKDAAGDALLTSQWQSTRAADYAAWQADKSAATPGTFTDQWITDRAAMLGWLVKRNLDDNTDATINAPQDLRYLDEARKIDLRLGGATGDDNRKKFHFGDDKANTLTGASKEDHLYGGAGADTLDGKDGADYLEGGADADTYLLQTGSSGIDTIVDSGANTLKIDGKSVSGAFAQVAGMGGDIYYSADPDKTYQLRKADGDVWRLSAKNAATGQYSAAADLKGWKDGDYGLTIGAPTQEPDRIAPILYPNSVAYLAMDGALAPMGVTFGGGTKSDSFTGSAYDDVITTGGGSGNYVNANGGDDLVVGGDGREFIRTGPNSASPTLKDNDIAFGGEGTDILLGGAGEDQLWGGYDDPANEQPGADSAERGDWLSGELGNDSLVGSRRSDVLFGGAGQDIAKGGAGDDLILGDAQYTPFSKAIGLDYAETLTQSFIWSDERQDMVKVAPGNYGLHPVMIASGQAYNWTWAPTAQGDYGLVAPVGLISEQRVAPGGADDRLYGGEGSDWIAGQTSADTLYGGAGDDLLYGDDIGMAEADSGADLMFGDAGNDRMYGGAKDDFMDGGADDDQLFGEAGNDKLLGSAGNDELSGGEGSDLLDGGAGDDRLLGGADADTLHGGQGADQLDGGAGADLLHGGAGKDELQGGAGDDTYLFDVGDDAGVTSTASDSEGLNTVQLSGGALADMELTGSDSAWLLRYSAQDAVQLNGSFSVQWGGRTYTTAQFAQAIADARQGGTPPTQPDNHAPSVAAPLQDATATADAPLVLTIPEATFADQDAGDRLTYSASLAGGAPLPPWLSFDPATRTLSGTPDSAAVDSLALEITATDQGGLSASTGFALGITGAANHAPTLAQPLPDLSTEEDTAWSYTVPAGTFADADAGDQLTYSASLAGGAPLPSWLSFDPATRTLSGTPDSAAVGTLALEITATDRGGLAASTGLALGITATNHAPTLAQPLPDLSTEEDTAWSYTVPAGTFADADAGDQLTYSASLAGGAPLPSWLSFDAASSTFSGTPPDAQALQLELVATDRAGAQATAALHLNVTATATPPTNEIAGTDADEVLKGTGGADTIRAGAGNDTLRGLAGDDVLYGDDGEDTLRGGEGNDQLYGGAQDDALYGDAGDDLLDGGAGNDILQGGLGNDTYLFGRGDGQDTLKGQKDTAPGKQNTLRFKDGVAASDVRASRDGAALLLTISDTGDSVRVESYFTSNNPGNDNNPLQQVQFADGTVWDLAAITELALTGTDASEVLKGTTEADTLHGGAGDDTLQGLAGDDLLDGGTGNDILQGGLGNDTYLFGRGDGQDTLKGQKDTAPGKHNTLRFKDGVAASDVRASRDGAALLLTISDTGDSVRVESYFTSNNPGNDNNPLQQVQFADGTVWDLAAITELALTGTDASEVLKGTTEADTIRAGAGNDTLQGLAGDDVLYGDDGEDTLRGGEGNDQLYGGAQDDALYGDAGDDLLDGGAGNDILQGGLGNDTYRFGRDYGADRITENDATAGNTDVLEFGAGVDADQLWFRRVGMNLEVSIIGSGDTCTIGQWYASDARHIEQFRTADGKTLLDSQVNSLVDAMSAFAPPPMGQSTLGPQHHAALDQVLAANWQ